MLLAGGLRTFNVRFSEKEYDETWAAVAVAKHIGSCHETLDMDDIRGTWDHITGLLRHAGQPFADTSLFAVNAVCRLMRQHVTVALSGDGGDEGFGGYDFYWQIARIARWQTLPVPVWRGAAVAAGALGPLRVVREHLPQRVRELAGADDTSIIQVCFAGYARKNTEVSAGIPMFFPSADCSSRSGSIIYRQAASRLERLSAHTQRRSIPG